MVALEDSFDPPEVEPAVPDSPLLAPLAVVGAGVRAAAAAESMDVPLICASPILPPNLNSVGSPCRSLFTGEESSSLKFGLAGFSLPLSGSLPLKLLPPLFPFFIRAMKFPILHGLLLPLELLLLLFCSNFLLSWRGSECAERRERTAMLETVELPMALLETALPTSLPDWLPVDRDLP